MAKRLFDTPVAIVNDAGQVREIATPFEAYTFLASRKTKRFDLANAMLRRKCAAASMGLTKTRSARDAFLRYAEKQGILAPDTASVSQAEPSGFGVVSPA